MNENEALHVGWCKICNQGWLTVRRTVDGGVYFIRCEECLQEWADPSKLSPKDSQAMQTFGRSRLATREEMAEHPWRALIENMAEI